MRTKKGKEAEEEGKRLHNELSAKGVDDESLRTIQAISRSDRIDFEVSYLITVVPTSPLTEKLQLVFSLVQHIVSTSKERGAILIFLPGVQEIRQCAEKLRGISGTEVLPLHANLSNDEQRRVFSPVKGWKIVVSTNVAEVSDCNSSFQDERNSLSVDFHHH